MKIAGIVVTYNRKEDLSKNIKSVLNQTIRLDRLYIVDNGSSDGTYDFLNSNYSFEENNIIYIGLNENCGGAGGFYWGMKRAYDDGIDFLFLMDDDGRPYDSVCIERIYDKALKLYEINEKLMLNSLVICDECAEKMSFGFGNIHVASQAREYANDGVINNLINPFNGTLISKELIKEIGFVDKDFFIRGDEVDYQSRALKSGAFIATVIDSLYYHPSPTLIPYNWRGKTVYMGTASPWKNYYQVRNYVYRIKRDNGLIDALKYYIAFLYGTIKIDNEWKKSFRMIWKGFFDGLAGNLGKIVLPGDK